jgi:release factor glutamine methyltransferase
MVSTSPKPAEHELASDPDQALYGLGVALAATGYQFTTMTPAGHAIVNARPENAVALDLAGVFGWNRPFPASLLPGNWLERMRMADAIDEMGPLLRSRVRFSSIAGHLLVHSGFPTSQHDAVFFGPDTYRFVSLLKRSLTGGGDLLDLGAGTGAAAICLAPGFNSVTMTDINPMAVRYADINAALAGISSATCVHSDLFSATSASFDAIVANPPYMIDPSGRWYRAGGGPLGIELAMRMLTQSLDHLRPGGSLIMYTGSPIIDGCDRFKLAITPILSALGIPFTYEELEVDVFCDELAQPGYHGVERIAVVAVLVGIT